MKILNKFKLAVDSSLPTWTWWILAVLAFSFSQYTMGWLNGLYQQTQFPVSFFVGQTTFDAAELKSYWQVLVDKNTLGDYVMVQIYDYAYMLTVFVSFGLCSIALYRAFPLVSKLRSVAWFFVLFTPQAASLDALENAVSFIMLMQPLSFADWLVHPYSLFASLKFAIYVIAYLWFMLGTALAIIINIYALIKNNRQHTADTH